MQAELIKRLFKAVSKGSDTELLFSCKKIIESERQKGHSVLAASLEKILESRDISKGSTKNLAKLPTSRRHNDPLVVVMSREELRHHMILNADVDSRFTRVEKEFAARDRLAKFGFSYKKKVLLYGPPGCGKTLGAERLAWNTGLPLIKVRFDAMISSYFGESASNLRNIFDTVKDVPSLLFLDECDFIAKSRNISNDVGEIPRIVNTLLQLLDDYNAPGLLVAATNLDKMLDKAIFRRFDDVFEVPMPTYMENLQLLKTTLAAVKTQDNLNWKDMASKLVGMSAANVVKVAQNAAKTAILEGNKVVRQMDLELALNEMYLKDQQGDLFHAT
ncbi:AAA family ATPase [Geomonas edaphica]|uniref:AAA family ATPase n=1 Tax=Geomonas edaphica TaxID=2570226 RepID=UPI0010A75F89|nr:ATP-binding protein [Geomonas edaphica]